MNLAIKIEPVGPYVPTGFDFIMYSAFMSFIHKNEGGVLFKKSKIAHGVLNA